MNAFDIPKNLVALLGALALAALLASAQPVQAEDAKHFVTPPTPSTHHIELNTLRKLLSNPNLSLEDHRQLQLELNEINEETA